MPSPTVATIKNVTQDEISGDGGKELKAVLHFNGTLKPMILNKGNGVTIAEIYGDDTAAWIGKAIEVYTDPSVMFGGKRVGGVRVRAPSNNPFAGSAPSGNGNGTVPKPSPTARWDVAHGRDKYPDQTTDDVWDLIGDGDPAQFWVKPAGAPREQAKKADQYGFILTNQEEEEDRIPF